MPEPTIKTKNRRRPWLAATLSLVMPGLGQIYCGRLVRGLALNFLNILPLPIIIGLFAVSTSSALMPAIITLISLGGLIQLIAIIDAGYLAHHAKEYQLKDYNKPIVYILLLLLITTGSAGSAFYLRGQLLEAFRVPVASNYPTILPGDRFLANKIAYKSADPKRGDLIVFVNPRDRRINYIKRIAAVAGDTVEIKDNEVYINDRKLEVHKLADSALDKIRIEIHGRLLEGDVYEETNGDAKYKILLAKLPHDKASPDFAKITVPKQHCFVLGDNRNNSLDSRHFGPVPLATVKGRADYLYWCSKDWSRFGKLN